MYQDMSWAVLLCGWHTMLMPISYRHQVCTWTHSICVVERMFHRYSTILLMYWIQLIKIRTWHRNACIAAPSSESMTRTCWHFVTFKHACMYLWTWGVQQHAGRTGNHNILEYTVTSSVSRISPHLEIPLNPCLWTLHTMHSLRISLVNS